MAEDEDESIIRKVEQGKPQITAGKEDPPFTDPDKNLVETEKNTQDTSKIPTKDEKSSNTFAPKKHLEHEPAVIDTNQNIGKVEKRMAGTSIPGLIARKPIIVILIIGAIILGGFLLYSQIQLSNQAYKVENYNALWNQSLADLRGGNTSLVDYCNKLVHDDDLCNRFMNLQYMG
jgi:hypothetical protein